MRSTPLTLVFCAALLAAPGLLTSCGKKDDKKKTSQKADRTPLAIVKPEKREDGLFYLPGAKEPFTGDGITPNPKAPWVVQKREPFVAGKRHGGVTDYYRNGNPKQIRNYVHGVPQNVVSYYASGPMKFDLKLNANDKGEGPIVRRWEDGALQCEANFDSEERWHGDFKEYDEKGVLRNHIRWNHGKLVQIYQEDAETVKKREAMGLKLQPEFDTPEAAPAAAATPPETPPPAPVPGQ